MYNTYYTIGEKFANFSKFYNGNEQILCIIVIRRTSYTYDMLGQKFTNFKEFYNGYEHTDQLCCKLVILVVLSIKLFWCSYFWRFCFVIH